VITQETFLNPIPPGLTAVQVAAACYKKWMGDASLEEDIAHYMVYGCVLSFPTCFALLKAIEDPKTKEPAWFLRMAVGRLDEMIYHMPFYLPRICFCRRNDGRLRSYSMERYTQLVGGKLYGRFRQRIDS
jgi:hypothetical protein